MSDASNAGARLEQPEPGIALLRLDRPANLNALTDDTIVEIGRLLDVVNADHATRVLYFGLASADRG